MLSGTGWRANVVVWSRATRPAAGRTAAFRRLTRTGRAGRRSAACGHRVAREPLEFLNLSHSFSVSAAVPVEHFAVTR